MDGLTSLGLILLLALLAGHLARCVSVPEVTGYILAGMVIGPSALGWLSRDSLLAAHTIGEVALGLILFSVGSAFESHRFRRIGRQVVRITLAQSALAGALVAGGMLLLGQPWPIACLLGAIATETAPASTLMVIRECDSSGPITDHLLGVIAVNNILCIAAFSLVVAAIDLTGGLASQSLLRTVYESGFWLIWQLAGSTAVGVLIGLMLAGWASQVTQGGERLILLVGCLLFCVGLSNLLHLSSLVASLAVGATMVNLSTQSRSLFDTLAGTDPPLYAIFFVIAGAELNLSLVPTVGWLGAVYILGRAGGKLAGTRLATGQLGLGSTVQRYLGLGLLAQAGLAIGLTLSIDQRYPALAPIVSTVVLASVAVFEIVGPSSARFALVKGGEAQPAGQPRLHPVAETLRES